MGMRKLSQIWSSCKLSSVKSICRMLVSSQPVIKGEAGGLLVLMIHIAFHSSTQSVKPLAGFSERILMGRGYHFAKGMCN